MLTVWKTEEIRMAESIIHVRNVVQKQEEEKYILLLKVTDTIHSLIVRD